MKHKKMFEKILINNRGEIACRIIKTAKRLGIKTVAVYSDVDESARFVRMADEAVALIGNDAASTYLNIEKIIQAAKSTGAAAIHPGYGFLSENAEFARECEKNGIVFIGASAQSIELMGLKDSAKEIAIKANVPVLAGYMGENQDALNLGLAAEKIGFPILIKAIAGGGGRGIRQVNSFDEFNTALESAKREAKSAFNDDRMMLEKLVERPRHIEVQIFGDSFGNIVHLFERDCSVQRRRQKLIEEAPAPNLPEDVRDAMYNAAIKLAKSVNYQGAGTIEFIVDGKSTPSLESFWFLEMNTRLQVEHPVTEVITDLDLVEWQIRVANGEKLPLSQNEIQCNGHAIEARVVAEDANNNFLPSSGIYRRDDINSYGVRIDCGFDNGDFIPANYDSLIEKIICWGYTRESAIDELKSRLIPAKYDGFANNGGFLNRVLELEDFLEANLYTAIIEENFHKLARKNPNDLAIIGLGAAIKYLLSIKSNNSFHNYAGFRVNGVNGTVIEFLVDNILVELLVIDLGHQLKVKMKDEEILFDKSNFDFVTNTYFCEGEYSDQYIYFTPKPNMVKIFIDGEGYEFCGQKFDSSQNATAHSDEIIANLPGKIVAINNKVGDKVKKGQTIVIIEAMKMEHSLVANMDGEIIELPHAINSQVKLGQLIAKLG